MGVSGYNAPGSSTWHQDQRCSGTVFSAMDAMDSHVGENRGLSPCGNCCGGEWPHDDEESGRNPDEWKAKLEPRETAFKLTSGAWSGPEYVGLADDETFLRWPVGRDMEVRASSDDSQFVSDIEDGDIVVETVAFEETPLTDYDPDEGDDDA